MAKASKTKSVSNGGANLGFEAKLWLAADKLRNNMDAAEYKHVVLGLTSTMWRRTPSTTTLRKFSLTANCLPIQLFEIFE